MLFRRNKQHACEPTLAQVEARELQIRSYERVAMIRQKLEGVLDVALADGHRTKILTASGQSRAWLHHLHDDEYGGVLVEDGARTAFGFTHNADNTVLYMHPSDEPHLTEIRMRPGVSSLPELELRVGQVLLPVISEIGQARISRLQKIVDTFGELALKSA